MTINEGYNYAREFFNESTSASYDSVVYFATFGRDRFWKDQIVKIVDNGAPEPAAILDLAAGTGVLSSRLEQTPDKNTVYSLDLTLDYLKKAKEKSSTLSLLNSTAELLPFRGEIFDSIVSSYLAKYIDIESVVQESWRVLKHDGVIVFHDFTLPENRIVERFWKIHFLLLKLCGKLLKEWAPTFDKLDKLIYKTEAWPDETIRYLKKTGFVKVFCKYYTLGTTAIVYARKE